MASSSTDIRVVDNPAARRYELQLDGAVAGVIGYALGDDAITLFHTEVDPSYEGQGLGAQLVSGALDDIRARGLRMIPLCPFVRSYLERHPEYANLVATASEIGGTPAP